MTMRKNPNQREIIKNMILLRKYNKNSVFKITQETNKQNNSSAYIKGRVNANTNICQLAP